MKENENDGLKRLLQQALPRVENDPEPARDLWPVMLRRLDQRPAPVPWFDWALAGGLALTVIAFPTAIPMLLYYL